MADTGNLDMDGPAIEDGFVHINGETHVLNYDTNILNLDENREVTPVVEIDLEDAPNSTSTDSVEEDVEVGFIYFLKKCP